VRGSVFAAPCALLAIGCVSNQQTSVDSSVARAGLPGSKLTSVNRTDIDSNVFDVSGCGRTARYMCFRPYQSGTYCAREPGPDPAEEAARPKLPPPAAPPAPTVRQIPG
jgi:hypothetical protein